MAAPLAAALAVWLAPPAHAANADFCVTCKNPDETYRCRVTGVKASDALKLYCVIRTAKEGKHASCSAEKATKACVGIVKVYNYDGPTLPEGLTSDPRVLELKQKVEQNQRSFETPKGDAPKSLFELGGRAMNASRQGLRNAGSAMGLNSSGEQAPVAPPGDQALPAVEPVPSVPAGSLPAQPPAASVIAESESSGMGRRMKQAGQDAGSAVGGFARKSYRCVVSFFSNCREQESGALE